MPAGASVKLRQALELVTPLARSGKLWTHPQLRRLYPRYLMVAYQVARSSVPLMMAARDTAAGIDGPETCALVDYLDKHIPEERGHDEWLLDDLEVLGFDREAARDRVPSPTVAAFVGAQYYYITTSRPLAILGYLAMMEGYPPTDLMCRSVVELTGYPASAVQTLRKHANLDPFHKVELDAVLDQSELTVGTLSLIMTNAMATKARAAEIINEIVEEHPMTRFSDGDND